MASQKISDMTAASDLTGAVIPIVQGGVNKKADSTLFAGSSTPGGSDTEVQYNDGGAFAGISGATTDGTILSVTTAAVNTNTTQAASTEFVQTQLNSGANLSSVGAKLYLFNAY